MLNYNQKMSVIFKDGDILTARYHGCINGLGSMQKPITDDEKEKVTLLANSKTYSEVRKENNRTPYKQYMNQFN